MARWAPATTERLQKAALDLFSARGFDQVTAAQIAEAAGTTERTFFRYFPDKRDVLFDRHNTLVLTIVDGVHRAPASASPLQLVAAAVRAGAEFFTNDDRAHARARHAIIASTPALLERERHKSADVAQRVAQALRDRAFDEVTATLAAESAGTIFHLAFTRWLADESARPLSAIADAVMHQFTTLSSATPILHQGDVSH